jgi:hypothetical protein
MLHSAHLHGPGLLRAGNRVCGIDGREERCGGCGTGQRVVVVDVFAPAWPGGGVRGEAVCFCCVSGRAVVCYLVPRRWSVFCFSVVLFFFFVHFFFCVPWPLPRTCLSLSTWGARAAVGVSAESPLISCPSFQCLVFLVCFCAFALGLPASVWFFSCISRYHIEFAHEKTYRRRRRRRRGGGGGTRRWGGCGEEETDGRERQDRTERTGGRPGRLSRRGGEKTFV